MSLRHFLFAVSFFTLALTIIAWAVTIYCWCTITPFTWMLTAFQIILYYVIYKLGQSK